MFDTLSDRLSGAFRTLRGKTRLTDADIDATAREIRLALLEADVNLAVVKDFIAAVKERAHGAELTGALNPGQQSSRSSTTNWSRSSAGRRDRCASPSGPRP